MVFAFFVYLMNRRNFIRGSAAFSALGLVNQNMKAEDPMPYAYKQTVKIKPDRLRPGDTIGLIAPGFLLSEKQLETSVNNLRQLGFHPFYTSRISGKYGYFSGTDKERSADLNEMFANPEIKGIISAGGGYGSSRILDMIDYELIKNNPKVLMGFSDVTALLNAVNQQTGMIVFHGPVARTIHRSYNTLQFKNIIVEPIDNYLIESKDDDLKQSEKDPVYDRYTIFPGKTSGALAGGNLSLVSSLCGTKYQLDSRGKILFLEDIDEEPYRIDRMLTQLICSGVLQHAAGVVFGILKGCNKADIYKSCSLKQVIMDRIQPLQIPSVYGLSFGHNINNCTLPIGAIVELNADRKILKLKEKAVI